MVPTDVPLAAADLGGTDIPESEPSDDGIEVMRAEDEALDERGR